MPLTNYDYAVPLFEGQMDGQGGTNVASYAAEGDIPFGRVLVQGTADNQATLPSATGGTFVGFSVSTSGIEGYLITETVATGVTQEVFGVKDSGMVSVGRRGLIGVVSETAMATTDTVFFRHTANGDNKSVIGRVRNDDDGASATVDALPAGTYAVRKGCAAGGICLIDVNLP